MSRLNQSRKPQQSRQECYSTRQPDGTVITTTSRIHTKYIEDVEDNVYGCGIGTINERYCCKPQGILRIIEIILGLVIVSLITSVFGPGPFKGVLFGQTFLLIFVTVCLTLTFLFLVVFFFNLHETHLNLWPWNVSVSVNLRESRTKRYSLGKFCLKFKSNSCLQYCIRNAFLGFPLLRCRLCRIYCVELRWGILCNRRLVEQLQWHWRRRNHTQRMSSYLWMGFCCVFLLPKRNSLRY